MSARRRASSRACRGVSAGFAAAVDSVVRGVVSGVACLPPQPEASTTNRMATPAFTAQTLANRVCRCSIDRECYAFSYLESFERQLGDQEKKRLKSLASLPAPVPL